MRKKMKLQRAGIVVLVLLMGVSGVGWLRSGAPGLAAYAQEEERGEEMLLGLLAALAGAAAKNPEVARILGVAGITAPKAAELVAAFTRQFQAHPNLQTERQIYDALADQTSFTNIIRTVLSGVVQELGGDVSAAQGEIDAYTPELRGFQVVTMEQVDAPTLQSTASSFMGSLTIPADADDAYWDSQIDPYVDLVRRNVLGYLFSVRQMW
jgi:hypothetical protein